MKLVVATLARRFLPQYWLMVEMARFQWTRLQWSRCFVTDTGS